MMIFKIDEKEPQAEKLIAFLKTLSYIELVEDNSSEIASGDSDTTNLNITEERDQEEGLYDFKEIGEYLEMDMFCFVHKVTGELIYYPKGVEEYGDPEEWQEIFDKVEADEAYIPLNPMESWESFAVMEAFVEQLENKPIKEELSKALVRKKPFRNFGNIIHASEFRQEWFDFKAKRFQDFAREQLEENLGED